MIEVTTKDEIGNREQWRFSVSTGFSDKVTIRLSSYTTQTRPTKRHKWTVDKKWDGFDQRSYNSSLRKEDVSIPEWVKKEAMSKIEINIMGVGE